MLPKGITASELLKARVTIYEAVINSASKNNLDKSEVPGIAEKIWDKIIEPLVEPEKPNSDKPASPQRQAR